MRSVREGIRQKLHVMANMVAGTSRFPKGQTRTSAYSDSPPGARPPSCLLSVLGHPLLGRLMWSTLLIMSCIMVFHNLVLQTWGIGTFDSITKRFEGEFLRAYFKSSPLYDEDGKSAFLAYARTPAGRFMHILPAGLWSVIAPLQLSPTFRAKYRTTHRRLGRLFIVMSISMAFGVVPIILSGASTIRSSVIFDGILFTLAAYFLASAVIATIHARRKRFADHRTWILRHVAIGYSVHLMRLLGGLSWWVFPLILPGYVEATPRGAQLRSDVFGLYYFGSVIIAVVSMELWLQHTTPSGRVIGGGTQDKTLAADRSQ